jgi:hypothetical protein
MAKGTKGRKADLRRISDRTSYTIDEAAALFGFQPNTVRRCAT